jgi:hypothetical protein
MADTFTVDVSAITQLAAAFRAAPAFAEQEMRKASDASLYLVVATLKEYPPERPGQTYVRTRLLGRTWQAARPTWQAAANGFQGRVGNATPYGPRVQQEGNQAAVHQGRWTTDAQALEQNRDGIDEQFVGANQRTLQHIAEAI